MKRNLFMPALFPLVLVQSASRLTRRARAEHSVAQRKGESDEKRSGCCGGGRG